ncbi:MAG: hypothetical protein NTW28_03625 [Candidatus Solibacter sp.]|nr:hypothetical protein [Candidatus Solibacter sp.]
MNHAELTILAAIRFTEGRHGGLPHRRLAGEMKGPKARGSFQPFGERNTTTFDDRSDSAKRENATAMMGHNDLLRSGRVSLFLMASGLSDPLKAVTPQDANQLIGTEPRRAAITQQSPRPVARLSGQSLPVIQRG